MSTPKGIFLELIKPDGQPERQLCQYEALHMCLTDPINTYLRGNRKRGSVSKDRWGTTISFPEDARWARSAHWAVASSWRTSWGCLLRSSTPPAVRNLRKLKGPSYFTSPFR